MRTVPLRLFEPTLVARALVAAAALAVGCAGVNGSSPATGQGGSGGNAGGSGSGSSSGSGGGTGGASGSGVGGGGGSQQCRGLQCQIQACPAGSPTTVTGTVYAPNGTLPLYNALVYVPNDPVGPMPKGLSCDHCGAIPLGAPGVPIGAALTDSMGRFKLENFPVGKNIPIVIQVGKWRRQITVPQTTACTTTALTDPQQTRLPRNRTEGDMPHIAITTGTCDTLTCMLAKVGVDPGEFGIEGEDKAVIFYGGAEMGQDPYFNVRYDTHLQRMTSARDLWRSLDMLKTFDTVLASCECTFVDTNKGPAAYQAVTDYLSMGGRLFGTDQMFLWYSNSTDPNLQGAATYKTGTYGLAPIALDTTFAKGKALADWLAVVAPEQPYAQVTAEQVYDNFASVTQPPWQQWAASPIAGTVSDIGPRMFTINTPAGATADKQCGKAVHLDFHVTQIDLLDAKFPDTCGAFANGEQVLAFFLFDVANCIQDDWKPIVPPPVVQ